MVDRQQLSVKEETTLYFADCVISEKLGQPKVFMSFKTAEVSFTALEKFQEKIGLLLIERSEAICRRYAAGVFDDPLIEKARELPVFLRQIKLL